VGRGVILAKVPGRGKATYLTLRNGGKS
jgi:hypothetical protein